MQAKAHVPAALALTGFILMPNTLKLCSIDIASAILGSVTPDIDVSTSESHKDLLKISEIFFVTLATIALIEYYFHLGILTLLLSQSNYIRVTIGIIAFMIMSFIGLHTPHRTFMHSILGFLTFSLIIFFIFPNAMLPFSISYASHIFLDLFNKKKIKLFFPLDFKIGLGLCSSDGIINALITSIGTTIFIIEIIIFLMKFLT